MTKSSKAILKGLQLQNKLKQQTTNTTYLKQHQTMFQSNVFPCYHMRIATNWQWYNKTQLTRQLSCLLQRIILIQKTMLKACKRVQMCYTVSSHTQLHRVYSGWPPLQKDKLTLQARPYYLTRHLCVSERRLSLALVQTIFCAPKQPIIATHLQHFQNYRTVAVAWNKS